MNYNYSDGQWNSTPVHLATWLLGNPKSWEIAVDLPVTWLVCAACYCPVWWISSGRLVFCPPTDAELSAMPFIWFNNIGVYTLVKLCVLEEKQDQSPSPLCAVIKPTAGSSHYAIRASRRTWSVALRGRTSPFFPLSPAPVYCKTEVCWPKQPRS